MNVILGELKEQTVYTCLVSSGDYTHLKTFKSLEEFDRFKRSLWQKWDALQVCDTAKKFPIGSKLIHFSQMSARDCTVKSYDLICYDLICDKFGTALPGVTIEYANGEARSILLDHIGEYDRLLHSLEELREVPQC
jgi:hypothetical protein